MAALQRHIHLSDTLGSAPENAPNLKWVITDRAEIPVINISIKRGLTGVLYNHVMVNSGNIVQLTNFKYTIKVQDDQTYTRWQRRDLLKALHGKPVYLVDSYHANDGVDHTSDVREMVISSIGAFTPIGPGLPFWQVEVELEDASL